VTGDFIAQAVAFTATRVRRWAPEERHYSSFIRPDRLITNTPCNYSLNLYTRCPMRCAYCCTGAQGVPIPMGSISSIVARLEEELAALPPWEFIGVGTSVDAYPSIEAEHRCTRAALEVLIAAERLFSIVTKGPLVLRDCDLLAEQPLAEVQISICSLDDEALAPIEPGAAPASARVRLVEQLVAAGVPTTVSASPWIPDISDTRAIVAALPPEVPIAVQALNVTPPDVARHPYGRRFDQREINERFLAEIDAVGTPDNVGWFAPTDPDPEADPALYEFASTGPIFASWVRSRFTMTHEIWEREHAPGQLTCDRPTPTAIRTRSTAHG
jgi:hypothetical protein